MQEIASLTPYIESWLSSEKEEPATLITGLSATQQGTYIQSLLKELSASFDHLVIAPDGHTIKVKQIKALEETLHTTSFKGKRLIIFQEIERIVPAAANMMLKSLEEPSKTNRFLLFTAFPRQVLPTIKSRCYRIRINSPEEKGDQSVSLPDFLKTLPSQALSSEHVASLSTWLSEHSGHITTVQPALYSVLMRVRDYYKIRSSNGNEKLASDALLASLNHLRNTIK